MTYRAVHVVAAPLSPAHTARDVAEIEHIDMNGSTQTARDVARRRSALSGINAAEIETGSI
jgi:hypothetical protein